MNKNEILDKYWEVIHILTRTLIAKRKFIERDVEYEIDRQVETDGKNQIWYDEYFTKKQQGIKLVNNLILTYEQQLQSIIKEASTYDIDLPLESLAEKHSLTREQVYIIYIIFNNRIDSDSNSVVGRNLLISLGYSPDKFIEKSVIITDLLEKDIIKPVTLYDDNLLSSYMSLTEKTLRSIVGHDIYKYLFTDISEDKLRQAGSVREKQDNINALINIHKPKLEFNQIILDEEKKKDIELALFQIQNASKLYEKWGLSDTVKYGKGMIVLFYGPPGTGKTATCEAIANKLNKKVGIINYAEMLNCWFGESEKNLVKIFRTARKDNFVLVFDEADALFGQRLVEKQSTDRLHNYMTNVLMQELEKFEGVCILTTNHEPALDGAFARRILLKLNFNAPKAPERAKIWRALIPNKAPLANDVNFNKLGDEFELTGGEIKNVVMKAIIESEYRGNDEITYEILAEFANKELPTAINKRKKQEVGFVVK